MYVRLLRAAFVALAAAVVAAAATGPALAERTTKHGGVRIVAKPLFRTQGGRVYCGMKPAGGRDLLVCWVPRTGYTIRLTPGGGIPKSGLVEKNRGRPPRPTAFSLLRVGHKLERPPFHCRGMGHAEARCWNKAQHGFQVGGKGGYLF
jgi:hypothetical protein